VIFRKKSWLLLFHVMNFVAEFVRTFRRRVIVLAVFCISFTICFVADNNVLLAVSATIIVITILMTFVRVFIDTLSPSNVFTFYKKCFLWVNTSYLANMRDMSEITGVSVTLMTERQLFIYKPNLSSTVLANRLLLFTATKLRDYQRSAVGIVGGIILFFFLWIYTIVAFAAINSALYKLDPSQFMVTAILTDFTFFHYSFYAAVYSQVPEMVAVSTWSMAIAMSEVAFAIITLAVFAAAMIITLGEQYFSQLDDLIQDARRESQKTERFINVGFGLSSVDALWKNYNV